ncbi:AAA family ATPase [Dactylosporangium sp. CA-139066]|uniref:AAA family ATPase n=1 Tax=Dactylosporangium sp. CA-139066 TaxID=3239930 RepID=UPI003D8C789C
MHTRHRADISAGFDPAAAQPPSREIERLVVRPGAEPVAVAEIVQREPYRTSAGLAEAVNVAIALGRPLLLQGDPGAGKTRLAHAVAYAMGLPLEAAYIKSTSRGQDLLYTFDAVRRLYDAQIGGRAQADPVAYVQLGPLGRAIARAAAGRRSVVLIDEIDKADLDFPNDLLHELDRLAFDVPEVADLRYEAGAEPEHRPIIIVTNNEEKTLPGAFLRRCVFHYVAFPTDPTELDEIMQLHGIDSPELRHRAAQTLLHLRSRGLERNPGLSELLDWAVYMQAAGTSPEDVSVERLPYAGTLVKQRSDQLRLRGQAARP